MIKLMKLLMNLPNSYVGNHGTNLSLERGVWGYLVGGASRAIPIDSNKNK